MKVGSIIKTGVAGLGAYIGIKTARKIWNLVMGALILYGLANLFNFIPQVQQFTARAWYVFLVFVGWYLWFPKKEKQTPETKVRHRFDIDGECLEHHSYSCPKTLWQRIHQPPTMALIGLILTVAAAVYAFSGCDDCSSGSTYTIGQTINVINTNGEPVEAVVTEKTDSSSALKVAIDNQGEYWVNAERLQIPKCKDGDVVVTHDGERGEVIRWSASRNVYVTSSNIPNLAPYEVKECGKNI